MTPILTETTQETMTGGKAVVEALKAEGVDTVFGIISIHMLPVYDALRADPSIRLIIPRHEMAGGFMADAYSRVTGKPGVFFTSTGPGAANSMGAVIESGYTCSRTLQITSQIESNVLDQGKCSLHEVKDQLGMFNATGAVGVRASTTLEIAPAIHRAMLNLRVGCPRPQVVEIPIDRQYATAEIGVGALETPPAPEAPAADLDRAAEILARAERPVIWVGGGVNGAGAHAELLELAGRLGAAVFTTRGGRGAISDDHPWVVGNYFGERPGRNFLESADAILALGTKFSWHTTSQFGLKLSAKIVRVDIDPEMIEQNYPPEVGLCADIRLVLAGLNGRLRALGAAPSDEFEMAVAELKRELREGFRKIRPLTAELMDGIERAMPQETILVTDSTMPGYWGGNQYLPIRSERAFVTPRLAAIGPGYPMALGAQAAFPDRPVLCFAGDGGFVMHIGEFATAVQESLNVVLLIFNNRGYGVLKRLQKAMMGGRTFATDLVTPDFVKVGEGFGVAGERIEKAADLEAAVRRGFEKKGPYVIDVVAEFEG